MRKRMYQSKRLVQTLVCVCLLVCAFSITALAGETEDVRFGYTCLENENQQEIYRALQRMVPECRESIALDVRESRADIQLARDMFCADYPEYFWFGGYVRWWSNGKRIVELEAIYELNGKTVCDIRASKAEMESVVDEIFDDMPDWINNDLEIAYYLHEVVAERIIYEYGPNHQTAYGGLVDGEAVCAGYARSYQLLLNAAGIDAWYVSGMACNLDGSERGRHAWNLVWLDDTCVYTDVCWDDNQCAPTDYEYYNISLEQMSLDHRPSAEIADSLPECGHSELQVETRFVPTTTVDDTTPVEELLQYAVTVETDNYWKVSFQFRYVGENGYDWCWDQCRAIRDAINRGHCGYSVDYQGDIYRITLAFNIGGVYRRIDEDTVSIQMDYIDGFYAPDGVELLAAYYNADGQMVSMTKKYSLAPDDSCYFLAECPEDFAQCRVFTLDAQTMRPLGNEAHLIAVQ